MTEHTHIRLPNWLGDVVMALPVVRVLAAANPNPELHGLAGFAPLLQALNITLPYQPLPAKNWRYYPSFYRQRGRYAQSILFANSQRADMEAFLLGAKKRCGIAWPSRPRRLLNMRYQITHPEADQNRHQTELWADFTAHFGLQSGINLTPLCQTQTRENRIILIAGSENSPEKRWPAAHWQALLAALLKDTSCTLTLCGTAKDRAITDEITGSVKDARVENLAGETGIADYLELLKTARLVIGNDTGGLHLANAAGTPVIGLYGPTNPLRTRPIFASPLTVLQPADCPPSGGAPIEKIAPETVLQTALQML